jgi:hypothetical protein
MICAKKDDDVSFFKMTTSQSTILRAGLVSGTLDITDALVFYGLRGAKAIATLQSIASGLLGRAAFRGGVGDLPVETAPIVTGDSVCR